MGPDLIEVRTFPAAIVLSGNPVRKPFTSTGFYNWFKRAW
jgi:hypothetical protein